MELFAIIIIILIVVVVTLLGSLLKGAEEPPRPLRPMPGENRPRPMTEVDKFLEEINRLKRQAAGEQKSGPPPLPPPQAPLTPQPANEARRVEPLPSRMPAPRPRQSVPEPRSRPAPLRRPEAPPRPLRAPTPVPPRSNKPSTPEVLEVIPVPTPVETAPLTMHRRRWCSFAT
jgi:outer membrane biosynthesis protein TonB